MAENEPDLPPVADEEGGVMGLTEVEPSPVEETPAEFKEGYFPPAPTTSATTFGLGNHGPAYYLTRVQKYSSYAFTVFASFHVANTSIIPLLTRSVPKSNRYFLLTRPYYQSAITEPLVVALPLVAHIASGIALRFYRRRQALKRYGAETLRDRKTIPWPSLSGTSALGYALIPLAGFHVWTTRILPPYMHGDNSMISLSYISHGFALHPLVSFGGFTALAGVGTWHIVWGWAKWLGLSPTQVSVTESRRDLTKKRRWYTINGISVLLTGVWLAGALGIVGRGGKTGGWIGREFDELYNAMPFIRW
ncbi:hypothetical protein BU23DRAFT_525235 [Bimuria novae-zelandiae CBS 107.79]|uniref:Mitochondrial adapter protein MCP1 transmembrane domain-containing protein n=1 Tax=Bimuria novae-zelandiae CBS 107.79 TaxID=1447943 RepID=A0A6A5VLC1_9PLEO|nr:hypothetical protein BU23DRAFT_525235 [Bimuria novae-zelandiae CBS 107.79]